MRRHIFCFFVSLLPFLSVAQNNDTESIKAKVKTVKQLQIPNEELQTSTFSSLKKAGQFSNQRDSIHASACFLKISPYHLIYLMQTPRTIAAFLSGYCLTDSARKAYTRGFEAVYNAVKPEAYNKLEKMYRETLGLLHKLDSIPGKMKTEMEAKIHISDSVHFAYLVDEVQKSGWPDMAHGSLFAGYIAMRDVIHCYDYLPAALKAFSQGDLPLVAIHFMKFNQRYYGDYLWIKQLLSMGYVKYDISAVLASTMPSNISDIVAYVRSNCPIEDVITILESPRKLYRNKFIGDYLINERDHFSNKWHRFISDMRDACPAWKKGEEHPIVTYWQPYDRKEERVTLYIIKKR